MISIPGAGKNVVMSSIISPLLNFFASRSTVTTVILSLSSTISSTIVIDTLLMENQDGSDVNYYSSSNDSLLSNWPTCYLCIFTNSSSGTFPTDEMFLMVATLAIDFR